MADFWELEELVLSTSFPELQVRKNPGTMVSSLLCLIFIIVFIFLRYSDERFMKVSEIKVSCFADDSYYI